MKTMGSKRLRVLNGVVRQFGAVFSVALGSAYMAIYMQATLVDIGIMIFLISFGTILLSSYITENINENDLR